MNSEFNIKSKHKKLCSCLLLYCGDIKRYQNKEKFINETSNEYLTVYKKANLIYPFMGRTFNMIGISHDVKTEYWNYIYNLIRSISCDEPFTNGQETLFKAFDLIKMQYEEFESKSKNKVGISKGSLRQVLEIVILRGTGIVFTKIDREKYIDVIKLQKELLNSFLKNISMLPSIELSQEMNFLFELSILLVFCLHYSVSQNFSKLISEDADPYLKVISYETDIGQMSLLTLIDFISDIVEFSYKFNKYSSIILPFTYFLGSYPTILGYISNKFLNLKKRLRKLTKILKTNCIEKLELLSFFDFKLLGFLPCSKFIDKIFNTRYVKDPQKEEEVKIFNTYYSLNILGFEKIKEPKRKVIEAPQKAATKNTFLDYSPLDPLLSILDSSSKVQKIEEKKESQLIVIDVQNVALRHGNSETFSTKGITITYNFWKAKGHSTIGFIPDYILKPKKNLKKPDQFEDSKESKAKGDNKKNKYVPDDISVIQKFVDSGDIVCTPSFDYDDSYCIQYAKDNNGYIVSNDRFKDYIQKFSINEQENEQKWLKTHTISFTFSKDIFLPNPDSFFFRNLFKK